MTARIDFDRLLTNWMTDEVGPVEAATYLAETLELIDRTPQRPSRPWSGIALPRRWTRVELSAALRAAILVALLILALVAAALVGGFRLPPTVPVGPGLIFVTTGEGDLAVVDPEGGAKELGATASPETMTSVSPDGTRIAFWTWVVETDNAGIDTVTVPLTVAHIDGSDPTVILDGVDPPISTVEGRPEWSPDSRSLAFGSGGRIFRIAVDGTGLTTLADDGLLHRSAPSWSPDGNWIAIHASTPRDEPVARPIGSVHVVRPDGTEETVVSGDTQVWGGNFGPAWSADSRQLAYVTPETITDPQFGEFTVPGGIEIATLGPSGWVAAPVRGVEGIGDQVMLLWSPVGNRLAYVRETGANADGYLESLLTYVDEEGALHTVTDEPVSQGFCWSPDGTRIAAITVSGELVAYDVATGARDEAFVYPLTNLNVGDACVWSAWAGEAR